MTRSPLFGTDPRTLPLEQLLQRASPNGTRRLIYNSDGSPPVEVYAIDAKEAVTKFPELWSYDPWPKHRG